MISKNSIVDVFLKSFNHLHNHQPYPLVNIYTSDSLTPTRLADIIKCDHSLTAQIIAFANFSIYGSSKKFSTIEMAISILGTKTVKELITGFSLFNSIFHKRDRYFLPEEFNRHSQLCGYIAMLLANKFNYPEKSEAFIAGLLHDIGIPIIHQLMNNEFKLISELKFYRRISQTKAEKLIIGKTHCEIGGMVASKWNFSDKLVDGIKNHHSPSNSSINRKLSAIVHIADFISTNESPQFLLSSEDEQLDESVVEILNIPDLSHLFDIIYNISELMKKLKLFEDLEKCNR